MAIIPGTAKVLNQYENVNTTYGGSKAMKAQSKWYTMQDIEDTINASKPYKVFTALLTQSGSDGVTQGISSSPLIIGATYSIEDNGGSGWDFTNVGAPNNDVGTYFIATGENPNSWGIDGQLGYTPGAPVATVLENTIGNIWFTYEGVNQFKAKSNDLFTEDKTILFIQGSNDGDTSSASALNNLYWIDSNTVSCVVSGGNLNKTSIEIRVYN